MQIEELEQKLKNKELDDIYLLYGEETYLIDSTIKKIKNIFGELVLGINYFPIEENNIAEIIPSMETMAFGYNKKLILLKNIKLLGKESKKSKSDMSTIRNYINENIKYIRESVVLVIIESEVDKGSLLDTIYENGVVCNFENLKPLQLIGRLKAICNAYHVNVSESDLKYLLTVSGTNMQELINEIRKLIEYTGENGTITKKEIDLLCIKQLDSVIFDLTDALGKKDTKGALGILNELLILKEPIQRIIYATYGHFKKLYLFKLCDKCKRDVISEENSRRNSKLVTDSRRKENDVIKTLALRPNQTFLVNKYRMQAKYFTEEELEKLLYELTSLDANSKKGLIDVELGLESVFCNV